MMRALLWISLCMGLASAGPNADAVLHVDADYRTESIDYSLPGPPDFKLAVRVTGAVHLDGYAFDLQYDTAQAAFLGAEAGSPDDGLANFLETRGGQAVAFVGRPSTRGAGWITVANALAGSDSAKSPSGDGLLAVLSFHGKKPGIARFFPGKVELLDYKQESDTLVSFVGGSVDVQAPIAVRPSRPWILRFREPGDFNARDLLGRSPGRALPRSSPRGSPVR